MLSSTFCAFLKPVKILFSFLANISSAHFFVLCATHCGMLCVALGIPSLPSYLSDVLNCFCAMFLGKLIQSSLGNRYMNFQTFSRVPLDACCSFFSGPSSC